MVVNVFEKRNLEEIIRRINKGQFEDIDINIPYKIDDTAGELDIYAVTKKGTLRYYEYKKTLCDRSVRKALDQFKRFYAVHNDPCVCVLVTGTIRQGYKAKIYHRGDIQ